MTTPRLCFVVTCNAPSVALLAADMLPGAVCHVVDYLDPASYRPDALAALQADMGAADHIFVQRGGYGPLAHHALLQAYPDRVRGVATFWFRGLFPDGCYVGSVGDKFQDPSFYHNAALVATFRSGRSERWARKYAFTHDHFEKLNLFKAWDQGIDWLAREDQALDFPAAGLVDAYCRERLGFYSFNHPCLGLLHQYYHGVFSSLGLKPQNANLAALRDPMTAHDIVPVFDFVAEHYGLSYRTSPHWYLDHWKKYIDQDSYIRLCYETYRQTDPAKLTVSVPPDLVEAWQSDPSLQMLTPPAKEQLAASS